MSATVESRPLRSSSGSGIAHAGSPAARISRGHRRRDRVRRPHHAGRAAAERDRRRPRSAWRRPTTKSGLSSADPHDPVGQHQAALGVGVEHLDGLAAVDRDARRTAAVRRRRACSPPSPGSGHDLTGRSSSAAAAVIAASTAAAPPMSHFIVSIDFGGLSERPPESNVIPLPTSATGPGRLRVRVGEPDQPRRPGASPCRRRAGRRSRRPPARPRRAPPPRGRRPGRPPRPGRELGRRQVERRGVDQVAHQVDRVGDHLAATHRGGVALAGEHGHRDGNRGRRPVLAEGVRAEQRPGGDGLRLDGGPRGQRNGNRLNPVIPNGPRSSPPADRSAVPAARRRFSTSKAASPSPDALPSPTARTSVAGSLPPPGILVSSSSSPVAPRAASVSARVPPSASSTPSAPGATLGPSGVCATPMTRTSASTVSGCRLAVGKGDCHAADVIAPCPARMLPRARP